MRYSLSDYIVTITPSDTTLRSTFGNISIGGEGSAIGSISVSYNSTMFSTTPFATGAWVHNKNLNKSGTITIELSQLTEQVAKFKQMVNAYFSEDYDGFNVNIATRDSISVANANDCYFTKIPSQDFNESAQNQRWDITCGEIIFD